MNPIRTRYAWNVNEGTIYITMPTSMSGNDRRNWLRKNIESPDPSRPGERYRVQSIIDMRLGRSRHVHLTKRIINLIPNKDAGNLLGTTVEQELQVRGLSEVVAEEKATHIHIQRPAIRALGRSSLKSMIHRIFEELASGNYQERRLARNFGLSTATFSRFAGSRWRTIGTNSPPDLWRNVAQTLAGDAVFVELAKETGVWPQVQRILRDNSK